MKVDIHQIYFQRGQLKAIDPAFVPYDNSKSSNPDYREFYVFRKEYKAQRLAPEEYSGYVSWKFGSKTGLSGQQFIEFCKSNPGFDVYFINPFPLFVALGNVWECGEKFHPGLRALTRLILNNLRYNVDLDRVPNSLRLNAYCNFWAGNRKFWDAYMEFCLPIVDHIETRLDPQQKKKLFSKAGKSSRASYFAYIMERMFTTFLSMHPEIKCLGYRYSEQELAPRLSPNEIRLYRETLRLEDAHPNVPEPLQLSPAHQLALYYYRQANWNVKILKQIFRRAAESVWNLLPFRNALKRNQKIKQRLERWYQSLCREAK